MIACVIAKDELVVYVTVAICGILPQNRLNERINPFSAGIDFWLQSTDVRFWRLKSIPEQKEWKNGRRPVSCMPMYWNEAERAN